MSKKTMVLKSPAAVKEIKVPAGLESIDRLTEEHARNYNALAETMADLDGRIKALKADYVPTLRNLANAVKESHFVLNYAIAKAPNLFNKPRTHVLHGFEVGLRKMKGATVFKDEEKAIALIKKHFPDQADVLIAVKESIVKEAAGQLAAADLKKIGGEVTDPTDQVVIKSAIGDVTKIVDALLKEGEGD